MRRHRQSVCIVFVAPKSLTARNSRHISHIYKRTISKLPSATMRIFNSIASGRGLLIVREIHACIALFSHEPSNQQPSLHPPYANKNHARLTVATAELSSHKGQTKAIRRGRCLSVTNDFATNSHWCVCYTTSTPHSFRSAPPYAQQVPRQREHLWQNPYAHETLIRDTSIKTKHGFCLRQGRPSQAVLFCTGGRAQCAFDIWLRRRVRCGSPTLSYFATVFVASTDQVFHHPEL